MTADTPRTSPTRPGRWGELWGLLWRGALLLGGLGVLSYVGEWFGQHWESPDAEKVRGLALWLGLALLLLGFYAVSWRGERDEARAWLRWYVILAELRRYALEHPDERAVVAKALGAHNLAHSRPMWDEWKPVTARTLPRLESAGIREAAVLLAVFRPRENFQSDHSGRER